MSTATFHIYTRLADSTGKKTGSSLVLKNEYSTHCHILRKKSRAKSWKKKQEMLQCVTNAPEGPSHLEADHR